MNFLDTKSSFLEATVVLGWYLGPSKYVVSDMCCHILKSNVNIVQILTVGQLTPTEMASKESKKAMADLMLEIYDGPL